MKSFYKYLIALIIVNVSLSIINSVNAQTDSTKSTFTLSGYLEIYYSYDFGNPAHHNRQAFIYSHNRHNEVNLNLGFIKVSYNTKNVRANLSLATGTYMSANYAAEADVLKNIFEANAGVKISKEKELWIDAGIFPAHIGFESAVGKDNWTLTRGIYAENSPYFETGAKITYTTDDGKWILSGLLLNGWQRIQRINDNNSPAFGHQLVFKPNSKIILNSSSYIGNDKPDSTRQMRYFHNLYGIFQINSNFALTAGLDIGSEQITKGSNDYNSWYSPVVILKFSPNPKHSLAARAEYFSDKHGVIISTGTPNGFKTWGYSVNYDYLIRENVLWRIEGRRFLGKDKTFTKDGNPVNTNFFLTTSLTISL